MRFFNLTRTYSTLIRPGLQNTIYIEKSNLDTSLHSKIPVICLLGWTGARDSHLKKYSKIYSDLGYHTIRFSPSNKLTFLEYKQHHKYALELAGNLNENFKDNPLMFHFFSNAGLFIFYHHIINDLNKPEFNIFKQNEKGQIYDSGLGWTHSSVKLFKGITHLLESDIKFYPIRAIIAFYLCSLLEAYCLLNRKNNYFEQVFQTIVNDSRKLPALYLLSRADKLINPAAIEKNIAFRVNKFATNSINNKYYNKVKIYDDADHVLIYAKYPDDYIAQIKQHLKICNLEIKF